MPHIKSKVDLAKDVMHYASRIRRDCCETSNRDALLMAEVAIARYYLLLDLLDDPRCANGYRRALNSLAILDAKAYAESVKNLRSVFLRITETYHRGAIEDYVLQFKPGDDGIQYVWMVTPLRWIEKSISDDIAALSACLQWVSFDTKLNMADADFSEELSLEYLHDEYVMSRFDYDSDLISDLNQIVIEWCSSWDYSPEAAPWHYRHGNGATMEVSRSKSSPIRKSLEFSMTQDDFSYLKWRGSVEDLPPEEFVYKPFRACEEPIQVEFVPKSPLTNRVISKEHVTKMWLQNDLFWLLDTMFQDVHLNIDLHDQEKSRRMALQGSIRGQYDTFDYSKASDFVTNDLVERITRNTWLHDPLQWSRSKYVRVGRSTKRHKGLPTEVVIPLAKFAPMGSSTCFPVESLVFAALCELVIRRITGHRGRYSDYRVYGDDVVIRSDCSDELRFLSAMLHFSVNDSKTCRSTGPYYYREACGIEALNGKDVTPLRVSRRYVGCTYAVKGSTTTTPGEYLGCIDFINRCYLYGFTNLRRFLCGILSLWDRYYTIFRVGYSQYRQCEKQWREGKSGDTLPVPFFICDDGTDTNYRARSRGPGRSPIHRTEDFVWIVTSKTEHIKDIPLDCQEEIRYMLWLLQAQQWEGGPCSALDFLKDVEHRVTAGSASLRWKRRWVSLID